jgi:predicted DNA-binding transcriptional regulator YafY
MIDRLVRLLNIVNMIQSNPGIHAAELALKCDVTIRTIYRDLDTLSLVAPIVNEGRGAGYRFLGRFALYPLNFTEQEALAFSLLPSVIDEDTLPPGFRTAYHKVMAAHTKEKLQHNSIIENIADIIQMGTPAYRQESPNFLQPIIEAILAKRTIDTVYHTQSRNETTERLIDPYYLVPREQRFYLIGYCHLKEEVRTFRLSRFQRVELTSRTFDMGDFNIQKYLKHTWSIEQGEKEIRFKVRFYPEVARYIKEEELFVQPRMTDLPDGGMIFEVTVNNENEFIRWVLQYGPAAEILEPESARTLMKRQLAEWTARYATDQPI